MLIAISCGPKRLNWKALKALGETLAFEADLHYSAEIGEKREGCYAPVRTARGVHFQKLRAAMRPNTTIWTSTSIEAADRFLQLLRTTEISRLGKQTIRSFSHGVFVHIEIENLPLARRAARALVEYAAGETGRKVSPMKPARHTAT